MKVLALALALGAPAPEPEAPPTPVDLRWSAPAECPDAAAFLRATEELVGRTLALDEHANLRVDGRVIARDDGYELHLHFGESENQKVRALQASRCDLLVEAGSLVVATRLLDLLEEPTGTHVPVPATPPESPPTTAGEPAPPDTDAIDEPLEARPAARPPARAARPIRMAVAVLGGASFGAQPAVAGTLQGDAALLLASARVMVGARHGFATAMRTGEGFGVRVSATSAHVLGCWDPALGRIDVPVCAGIELGALVGRGDGGAQTSATSRQLFAAIPLQAGIGWAFVPRLALRADLRGTIALDRPGFHVDTPDGSLELFRMGAGSVGASVGLEVRFP